MMNMFTLVGRIFNDLKKGTINGKDIYQFKIAVTRSYKNEEGIYESDIIPITLISQSIAENTMQYLKKGDIVGVKGVIQMLDNNGVQNIIMVADKISFLSSATDK